MGVGVWILPPQSVATHEKNLTPVGTATSSTPALTPAPFGEKPGPQTLHGATVTAARSTNRRAMFALLGAVGVLFAMLVTIAIVVLTRRSGQEAGTTSEPVQAAVPTEIAPTETSQPTVAAPSVKADAASEPPTTEAAPKPTAERSAIRTTPTPVTKRATTTAAPKPSATAKKSKDYGF